MLASIPIRSFSLGILTLAAVLIVGASAEGAGTIDDWWLCVENCADEDPVCVDACTDAYNKAQSIDQCARTLGYRIKESTPVPLILRPRAATTRYVKPKGFLGTCPTGTVPWPFEMPVYDDHGLFVVDFETVYFCIDEDLEPAG